MKDGGEGEEVTSYRYLRKLFVCKVGRRASGVTDDSLLWRALRRSSFRMYTLQYIGGRSVCLEITVQQLSLVDLRKWAAWRFQQDFIDGTLIFMLACCTTYVQNAEFA